MEESRTRRVLKVAGLLLLLGVTLVWGMVIGGGLVYAWTQWRDAPGRPEISRAIVIPKSGLAPRVELFRRGIVTQDGSEAEVMVATGGAYVVTVVSGGPADEAGLEPGDQIVALDGRALDANGSLAERLADFRPGERVTLTVERPGEEPFQVRVRLAENPDRAGRAYLGIEYQVVQAPAGLRMVDPELFGLDRPFDGRGLAPECRCEDD